LVTGLAHTLKSDLCFGDTARQLADVIIARLTGNLAGERGDSIGEHGIGENGYA
jgi:hypothetical protein